MADAAAAVLPWVNASPPGANATLFGANGTLLLDAADAGWTETSCLEFQRSRQVTPLADTGALQVCVCLHANITAAEYRSWRCFEEPLNLPFFIVAWVGYALVFVTGLLGNGLVCYVVLASPRMRTVTNLFIVNMAVGDLLMTCLCMPLTFANVIVLRYWPFGDALCRGVSFAQALSVFVSAYTLVVISADRYSAIVYPLLPRGSRRRARIAVLAIWTLAAVTCVPIAVTSRTWVPQERRYAMHGRRICQEVWENGGRQYYSVVVLVLQYFLPVTVLAVTYCRIAVEVWGRGSLASCSQDNRQLRLARARRKTVQMMVIVVVAFTLCWLPTHVLQIVLDVDGSLADWDGILYLYTATHWLSMASCVCNPIIYCGMNVRFRNSFSAVFSRLLAPCRCRRRRLARPSMRSGTSSLSTSRTRRLLLGRRSTSSARSRDPPTRQPILLDARASVKEPTPGTAAEHLSLAITCGLSSDSPRELVALARLKGRVV